MKLRYTLFLRYNSARRDDELHMYVVTPGAKKCTPVQMHGGGHKYPSGMIFHDIPECFHNFTKSQTCLEKNEIAIHQYNSYIQSSDFLVKNKTKPTWKLCTGLGC